MRNYERIQVYVNFCLSLLYCFGVIYFLFFSFYLLFCVILFYLLISSFFYVTRYILLAGIQSIVQRQGHNC